MSTKKFKNRFNDTYESILKRYKKRVLFFIQKKWLSMGLVVASIVILVFFMNTTPTGMAVSYTHLLKENIILLMQHPIARRPISNLSDEEREKAFDLLNYLSTLSVDENYTLLDYIQMARLEYALGELEYQTTNDTEKVIRHFRTDVYKRQINVPTLNKNEYEYTI